MYDEKVKKKALLMFQKGKSISDIAKKIGANPNTVSKWIKSSKKMREGEKNAHTHAKYRQEPSDEICNDEQNKTEDGQSKTEDEQNKAENSEKDKCDTIIGSGLSIIEKRFLRALEEEKTFDRIYEFVKSIPPKEMNGRQRMDLLRMLECLNVTSVKEISLTIGTLFDKRMIMRGETSDKAQGGVVILPAIQIGDDDDDKQ